MAETPSPKKAFTVQAPPNAKPLPQKRDPQVELAPLREQDNAKPRIKPPVQARKPLPTFAPPGMSGIKTSARMGITQSPKPEKPRFTISETGKLTKTFKPLVQNDPAKVQDRGRGG